jgi:protocatechuate 3,4-dioxygenase beta subunit
MLNQDSPNKVSSSYRLKRRKILGFIGGTVSVSILGCFRGQSSFSKPLSQSTRSRITSCVVKPQQTEGPYFVDEKLNRSDIRSDPANGSIKRGVPLRLIFNVSGIDGSICKPLNGATVDIWHCDAAGVYSDAIDPSFNTIGQKFLRGSQVTNANGTVEFVTIYPGWYEGRTVHIHFKIRTKSVSQRNYEFTSQLYFPDALNDRISAQIPYARQGQRMDKNERDGIFQAGGEQLILQLAPAGTGYVSTFNIGLRTG